MTTTTPIITWRLVPRKDIGRVAWDMISTCPDGEGTFVVFSRTDVLMQQLPGLAALHRELFSCRCPTGEMIIGGATDEG